MAIEPDNNTSKRLGMDVRQPENELKVQNGGDSLGYTVVTGLFVTEGEVARITGDGEYTFEKSRQVLVY